MRRSTKISACTLDSLSTEDNYSVNINTCSRRALNSNARVFFEKEVNY